MCSASHDHSQPAADVMTFMSCFRSHCLLTILSLSQLELNGMRTATGGNTGLSMQSSHRLIRAQSTRRGRLSALAWS